jgi:hypothetical protein
VFFYMIKKFYKYFCERQGAEERFVASIYKICEQGSSDATMYFTKRRRRGALLLMIMVFVALIGLGAMYAIPPIEKQGRSALEDNYSTRLMNFYRALHDYQNIEDMDSTITVSGVGTITLSQAYADILSGNHKDAITRALMQRMIDLGYITKRQRDEQIFPITSSAMTWEVELTPLY